MSAVRPFAFLVMAPHYHGARHQIVAPTAFLARDMLIRNLATVGTYVDRDDVRPAERVVMQKEVGT